MRHDDAIVTESAGDDGRRHAGSTGAGGPAELIDAGIGGLNEARHQNRVRFAFRGGAKPGDQRFDGGLGGDFASLFAADAVGYGEKPAMRAALDLRRGRQVAEIVLIVFAYAAHVGQFGELKIQHGSG